MPFTIIFEPAGIRLVCAEPLTVISAARQAGLSLRSECGGKGTCRKCRVRLDTNPESLGNQLTENWHLACQTVVTKNIQIYIPPSSQQDEQVVRIDSETIPQSPSQIVSLFPITLTPPSLKNQTADFDRLSEALRIQYGLVLSHASLPVLTQLTQALRQHAWQITPVVAGDELIATFSATHSQALGLAVDVGTTKIACYLLDLSNGQVVAAKGVMNPQISYGEDIMSRLDAAITNPEHARLQQAEVVNSLNQVVLDLCASIGAAPGQLVDVCIVGNTAMHHLLLGLPVKSLAVSPFVPVIGQGVNISANDIGLSAAPGAHLHFPAPIAGRKIWRGSPHPPGRGYRDQYRNRFAGQWTDCILFHSIRAGIRRRPYLSRDACRSRGNRANSNR